MECLNCKKEFIPERYNSKYCNETCYKQAKAKRHWIKISKQFELICEFCSKVFQASDKAIKYCSNSCISKFL
jgi:hypothetical protein